MKTFLALLVTLGTGAICAARADLTIIENVEGEARTSAMTLKIKGDKARIDATPQMTTLVDSKNREMIQLMNDRKMFLRISGDRLQTALAMINRSADTSPANEKTKLTATGRKATQGGYQTEEYTCDTPNGKAAFWLAQSYPDAAAILKQLQVLSSGPWKLKNALTPDCANFPGVPLKFIVTIGGKDVTTTVTSIKQDKLNDSEFTAPADYQELKGPQSKSKTLEVSPPAGTPSP